MSKEALEARILAMNDKMDETIDGLTRGPVKDSVRVIVDMIKDQNKILMAVLHEIGS
jgi:hypothetical protein